jgi:hypothetical protein
MQIQLIVLSLLFSLNAFAVDDKAIQDLFKKYDQVMNQKKVELIDEVFSKKFIKDSGGKKKVIEDINSFPASPPALVPSTITWKKGKGEMYLAQMKKNSPDKSMNSAKTEFIIVIEDSKPKVEGTISDPE